MICDRATPWGSCLLSCPGRRKGHVCGRRYRASHVRPLGSKVFFYLALFGHPTVTLIKRGATLRTGRRRAAEASIVRRSASHSLSISSWSWQNLVKHASVTRWRWVPTRDLVGRPCSPCLLRRARLLRAVEVRYNAGWLTYRLVRSRQYASQDVLGFWRFGNLEKW